MKSLRQWMIKEPSSEPGTGKTLEANPCPVHRLAIEHAQPKGTPQRWVTDPLPLQPWASSKDTCHGRVHMHISRTVNGKFNKANSFLLALFCYKEKNMSHVLYAQICPSPKELIIFLIPSHAPGMWMYKILIFWLKKPIYALHPYEFTDRV